MQRALFNRPGEVWCRKIPMHEDRRIDAADALPQDLTPASFNFQNNQEHTMNSYRRAMLRGATALAMAGALPGTFLATSASHAAAAESAPNGVKALIYDVFGTLVG